VADAFIELPAPEALGRPENHPYNFGFVANMGRLLAAHPSIGPAFQQCFGAIMFAPGALDRREREMVAAAATRVQECFY
jgi:alkylhydroperoxidase/carboxymuconolactone decarboxylase family protein YurZ